MRRLVVAGLVAVALVAGSGTAEAADSLVLGSCAATVEVQPGQQISLSPDAVVQPITDVLTKLDPLGVLVPPFQSTWNSLPPIPIGTGPGAISGATIADAVVGRLRDLPLLAPVVDVLITPVRSALTAACGVLAQPVSPPPTASGGAPAPAVPGQPGPSGGAAAPSVQPTGQAFPGQPAAPGATPLPLPDANALPLDGIAFTYTGVPEVDPVRMEPQAVDTALAPNRADGLAASKPRPAGLLILLATLVLSLVVIQLVRTWVLRRPKHAR